MGLIKTAIMTGGGIYAVNKLAKVAERSHSSSYPNQNQNRNQHYSGPPPTPGFSSAESYNPQQYPQYQQQQWNQSRDQMYSHDDVGDAKAREGEFKYQSRQAPPAYYQQQAYGEENSRRGGRDVAGLAGMAMEFMGSPKEGKGKRVGEVVSEFMRK